MLQFFNRKSFTSEDQGNNECTCRNNLAKSPWEKSQKEMKPKVDEQVQGVQWAGEFHPNRNNFKKGKDDMAHWTNYAFRP